MPRNFILRLYQTAKFRCLVCFRLECGEPRDRCAQSSAIEVALERIHKFAFLIIPERDDVRRGLHDVRHVELCITQHRFVDEIARRNRELTFFLVEARQSSFGALCDRVPRNRDNEVRVSREGARLPKKIEMPFVEHVKRTENHDASHTARCVSSLFTRESMYSAPRSRSVPIHCPRCSPKYKPSSGIDAIRSEERR